MTTTIALYNTLRRPMLDLFTAPFRPRKHGLLDRRSLSDHFLGISACLTDACLPAPLAKQAL
ncbi:hypothetical protein NKH34_12765 [Mesorhizobium sp. M1148]|uniref:hypothetical protein n=1 Tax=unclassified Mesorhizobium TaxID=325217 RepID=UPI0033396EB2